MLVKLENYWRFLNQWFDTYFGGNDNYFLQSLHKLLLSDAVKRDKWIHLAHRHCQKGNEICSIYLACYRRIKPNLPEMGKTIHTKLGYARCLIL